MADIVRETNWFNLDAAFQNLGSGLTTNQTLLSDTTIGNRTIKGATVTRLIIDITIRNAVLAQNNVLYWGITKVNADARAAGAFPDPSDMNDKAGWMIRGRLQCNADSLTDPTQWVSRHYDLRAQRLFRNEEEELQLLIENSATGFTVSWTAFIRSLVKWPL